MECSIKSPLSVIYTAYYYNKIITENKRNYKRFIKKTIKMRFFSGKKKETQKEAAEYSVCR
jgi:hypothetical protein